ncbi:MAG: phosphate ABC transporter substrate-binding protein PstS [Candidatus Sulfotelmatobacter sp.]
MKAKVELGARRIASAHRRRAAFASRWMWLFAVASVLLISRAQAQQVLVLVGSGSTVPAPLYNRWSQEYEKRNPKIQMRYVPVGTEEGIKQISHDSGDFGAGEAPLTEKQRNEDGLTELPVALIGIVPVYNLPEAHQDLRLSGEVLADIFLGVVKTWNAPQIARLNPDVALPDMPIHVIQRPAGKGSNYVFSDFLSKASAKFRTQIGVSASPKWPVGEAADRSSDMADKVKHQPGSIGYVEYQYAVKESLQQAAVQNAATNFVKASPHGLAAACEESEAPAWRNFSASLVNARGADSYPITSFTWIYLRAKTSNSTRAAALSGFLNWTFSDGQTLAQQEGYTALPTKLQAELKRKLGELY